MVGLESKKNKSQVVTVALIIVVVVLMGSTFYISAVLLGSDEKGKGSTTVAPKKIKAANVTYNKLIALNNITPTDVSVPTEPVSISATPTGTAQSPSPTEIILARSPSITQESVASGAATSTTTPSPTKIVSLPKSGVINNALIIFSLSLLVVFFSFLF